jgi:hypothetical protein
MRTILLGFESQNKKNNKELETCFETGAHIIFPLLMNSILFLGKLETKQKSVLRFHSGPLPFVFKTGFPQVVSFPGGEKTTTWVYMYFAVLVS